MESFERGVKKEGDVDQFPQILQEIQRESYALDEKSRQSLEELVQGDSRDPRAAAMRKEVLEKFPIEERTGEVNGTTYRILGVTHSPEMLLYNRERMEQAIRDAGVIVLEAAPEISEESTETYLERIREQLQREGKSPKEIEETLSRNTDKNTRPFFHEMEQLAKRYQRPVITVDPHSGVGADASVEIREDGNAYDTLTKEAGNLSFGVNGVWGAALAAGAIPLMRHEMKKAAAPASQHTDEVPTLSRRDMLLATAGLTAGALVTPTALANMAGPLGPLEPVEYHLYDYRNTAVARGIDRYTKLKQVEGPVVVIYGARHAAGIDRYLRMPELRDAKYATYGPMRRMSPPYLREFLFSRSEDGSYAWREGVNEEI